MKNYLIKLLNDYLLRLADHLDELKKNRYKNILSDASGSWKKQSVEWVKHDIESMEYDKTERRKEYLKTGKKGNPREPDEDILPLMGKKD